MQRIRFKSWLAPFVGLVAVGACTRAPHRQSDAVFATRWQSETQYLVESILTNLTTMSYYAAHGGALDLQKLEVDARRMPTPAGAPLRYRIEIRAPQFSPVKTTVRLSSAIWDPQVYQGVLEKLFENLHVAAAGPAVDGDSERTCVRDLTDPTPEMIEQMNNVVSSDLRTNFRSPAVHERAALVLAAFTLREHAGIFFDDRAELCQMTAHLAFARALRHGEAPDMAGRLAGAALEALYGDQRMALNDLRRIRSEDPSVNAWIRALRMHITGDYRIIAGIDDPTLLERREWFAAEMRSIGSNVADDRLPVSDELRNLTDWSRILNDGAPSVELGHEILARSVPAELREEVEVATLEPGLVAPQRDLVANLNAEPGPCVTRAASGSAIVRVIGWGHWAAFFQRELCFAIQSDYNFLERDWGVPEQAREYRQYVDREFGSLRLYPFVRRQNATDVAYYRQAQVDEMKVVRRTPQLVPIAAWNEICFNVPFAKRYIPPPSALVNEWFRHDPPPGTAQDVSPRMWHRSLNGGPDYPAIMERMHAMAPYNDLITFYYLAICVGRDGRVPLTGSAMAKAYAPLLPYNPNMMARVANGFRSDPARYESWIERAAAINPAFDYNLAEFCRETGHDAEAARAYERIFTRDDDDVRVSNNCDWLVQYYERTGQAAKATALAERAAETYSSMGLQTLARLLESRGDWSGAFKFYGKVRERYDEPGPLVGCLLRYERATGKSDLAPSLRKVFDRVLPRGLEKFNVAKAGRPPADGVILQEDTVETRKAGLKRGDIIAGIRGYRVHSFAAYLAVRDMEFNTQFTLNVWRGGRYLELKAHPLDNMFDAEMDDYRAH